MDGTYDEGHDTAYLYLSSTSQERKVARTEEKERGILYDYNREGKIIGIEFLNASRDLSPSFLEKLTRI